MVTLKKIAEQAGVSVSTVSRILNGKAGDIGISPQRVKEVTRIARRMDFRFNSAARATRLQSTRHVGVLLRNVIDLPHYNLAAFEMILGINAKLSGAGYIVSIVRYGDRDGSVENQSRVFREQALDAMFVIGELPPDVTEKVKNLMPRCIWIESHQYTAENCIRRDEVYAGQLAGKALGDLGYRRWLWLNVTPPTTPKHYSNRDRLAGVRQMAGKYGAELMMFPQTDYLPSDPPLVQDYLQPDIGIIAYNTHHAQWFTTVASDLQKTAPADFGLVCCDENDAIHHTWPQLSRVGCDLFQLGFAAGEMALDLIQNPNKPCPSRQVRGFWIPGSTAYGPPK